MTNGDPHYYSSFVVDTTTTKTTGSGYYYDESSPNINDWQYKSLCPSCWPLLNNEKGGDNMRYLYEVILVNPKDDEFEIGNVVARSEVAALMYAYEDSKFNDTDKEYADFDDLKTQCRVLMQWKKEVSNNG